jgi:hypothetical protein
LSSPRLTFAQKVCAFGLPILHYTPPLVPLNRKSVANNGLVNINVQFLNEFLLTILFKEVARGGEQTQVLWISFIFSFFTTLPLSHSGSPILLTIIK